MSAKFWYELRKKVYKENETMEEFAVRVGQALLPGREVEWYKRHMFLLHTFGLAKCACKLCEGSCPYNGHRFGLKLNPHTDMLLLCCEAQHCPKYKAQEEQADDKQTK